MKTIFFSTKDFEKGYLEAAIKGSEDIVFVKEPLTLETSVKAKGFDAICIFAGDDSSGLVFFKVSQ